MASCTCMSILRCTSSTSEQNGAKQTQQQQQRKRRTGTRTRTNDQNANSSLFVTLIAKAFTLDKSQSVAKGVL